MIAAILIVLGLIACARAVIAMAQRAPVRERSDDNPKFYEAMEQAGIVQGRTHEGDKP